MQPNLLAPISIVLFPLLIWVFFLRLRPPAAVAVSLLVAEMFLPPQYTLPFPPFWWHKYFIPPAIAFVMVWFYGRSYLRRARAFRGVEAVFLVGVVGSFFTWWTNRDPIQYGPVTIPAITTQDFLVDIIGKIIDPWIVFFLGRTVFRTSRDLFTLCRMLVIAIAVYSLLILFEVRMSPNLNRLLYGFQASNFDMAIRWGGYRPLVFFPDGLHLTSFLLACTVMVAAVARAGRRVGFLPMKALSIYLVVVLVLCKSTGAILYGILLVPLVVFGTSRQMLLTAKVLTLIFLLYPVLRFFDLIPAKAIADFFGGLSTDRAGSLAYRFNMEMEMLDLTRSRPWWGWGGSGRNFTYDPKYGIPLSIPDGAVILSISTHGFLGFFGYFFPYAYPVFRAAKIVKKIKSRSDRLLLSALAVNCSVIFFDLIMNSSFFPVFMLFCGALYGLPPGLIAEEANARAEAEAEAVRSNSLAFGMES